MALADDVRELLTSRSDGSVGSVRVHPNGKTLQIRLSDDPGQPGQEQWWDLADAVEFIHRHMKAADVGDHPNPSDPPPDEEPPPVEEPPSEARELTVEASAMSLIGSQGFKLSGDHISDWGHPRETARFRVKATKPATGTIAMYYVAARESVGAAGSVRDVTVGSATKRVNFLPTSDTWAAPVKLQATAAISLPAGESDISISVPQDVPDWSNWVDLYKVVLHTDEIVSLVATVPPTTEPAPDPGGPPPPVVGTYDFVVGRDGTLQQLLDRGDLLQRPITIGVPSGVWGGAVILNKNYKGTTVFLEDGAIVRGSSGIEGYGGIENLRITCNPRKAFIEADGKQTFSEGIFIDSTRSDKGGNNQPAGNIIIENLVVRPIPGSGIIQRNGVAVWGADRVQVLGCEIHHASGNAVFGFGSAGSLISIGHSKRNPRVSGSHACVIRGNLLYNADISDGQVSADRNGIILDLYHANQGGGQPYSDRAVGPILVEDNVIRDVAGRGIQLLFAGLPDSPVLVQRNKVSGRYAYGLGDDPHQGNPKAAIAGYGGGVCSSVTVSNNEVDTAQGAGKAAYGFESFDGGDGSGVKGTGNKGTPATFYNSPTNNVPAGFL